MRNKFIIHKRLIITLYLIGQASFVSAQSYNFDAKKSTISFKVTHMGFLTVKGEFHNFSGKFTLNNDNLEAIESNVKVESIDTKDKTRDESLVDKAYLNAGKYPYINFTSTNIKTTFNTNTLTGILKIKNVKREISMPFELVRSQGKEEALLKISTSINRKDFKLNFGPMDVFIGDHIKIELKILGIDNL